MRVLSTLVCLLIAGPMAHVLAQQPGVPDPAAFTAMLTQMGPMYESVAQAMVDGTMKALERPETAERLARFARRYHDALVKEGFTREEALQIVAGIGIAVVKPSPRE